MLFKCRSHQQAICVSALTLALTACGGGGDDEASPISPAPAPTPDAGTSIPSPSPSPSPSPTPGTGTSTSPPSDSSPSPSPASPVTSTACFDAAALRTPGHTWRITRGGEIRKYSALGATTYRGRSAFEVQEESSGPVAVIARTYGSAGAINGFFESYGSLMTSPVVSETYYTPALQLPVELVANQPFAMTYQATTEQNNSTMVASDIEQTVTYLGREQIQTAFGTFETCHMQHTTRQGTAPAVTWSQWIVASGKLAGLSVQDDAAGSIAQPTLIETSWD